MRRKLSMFTQYGQFYIADRDALGESAGRVFWNDDALNDRLAIADGVLGVLIENDEATANIEIEWMESRIEVNLDDFDHVVEGSLYITSGKLQIQDCPNSQVELELDVEPAWYRIRVSSLDFEKAHQVNPEDKYVVTFWKEYHSPRNVIKRWRWR